MDVDEQQVLALTEALNQAGDLGRDIQLLHQDATRLARMLVDEELIEGDELVPGVRTDGLDRVPASVAASDLRDRVNRVQGKARRLVESARKPVASSEIGVPDNTSLPAIVYGCFKPGELAWPLIESHVDRFEEVRLDGYRIRRRDGLPLLEETGHRYAESVLLVPLQGEEGNLYETIGSFEPARQYRWDTIEVDATSEGNVLLGRDPDLASEHGSSAEWSAADDPVFRDGILTVERLTHEDSLFEWEAAFLLLWSITERYTALRFGPHRSAEARIDDLDRLPAFTEAVQAELRYRVEPVFDSWTLSEHQITDGSGAARYWYTIRCNLSHRGKGSGSDQVRLEQSLKTLTAVMKKLLGDQFPHLDGRWRSASGRGHAE